MSLPVWTTTKGGVLLVPVYPHAGAPSNGTSGTLAGFAQPGDLLVDTTGLVTYQNTGTQVSPTWTQISNNPGAVAITGGTIDGTVIGGITPAAGTFTALGATGLVNESAGTGLTASGTNQGTALALTKNINNVTTVASSTGVALPAPVAGMKVVVINAGANTLAIYGHGSDTIDGTAGATGTTLSVAHRIATFYAVSSSAWISSLGGAVSS